MGPDDELAAGSDQDDPSPSQAGEPGEKGSILDGVVRDARLGP
jgi:hypothetical protein